MIFETNSQKYIITADYHLDDYSRYNMYPKSRLYQSIEVAKMIGQLGKSSGAKVLILAGDIINKPINRPYINHVLKQVFDEFCNYFEKIYFIRGQHDLDSKASSYSYNDSDLNLYDGYKGKVFYAHNSYIKNHSGHITYLQDFYRGEEVPLPEDLNVDLMVGHYTIGNGLFSGQVIDNSKFKLGLFGDIHAEISKGNIHSISNPVQVKINEGGGKVVVLDTLSNTFSRVPFDLEGKIPKIKYTDDQSKHGPNEADNTFYVYKPNKNTSSVTSTELNEVPDWSRIEELVSSLIKSEGLEDLHNIIKDKIVYNPINFNFSLKYIDIENFRSIRNLRYEFIEGRPLLVVGENGSGKSSFIDSIGIALRGSKKLKDSITKKHNYCKIEIELEYENTLYRIIRHSHQGRIYI